MPNQTLIDTMLSGQKVRQGEEPSTSPESKRDWLDRLFLGGLRVAEAVGIGGTPLKLYNDVVQRGRRDPITEKDFPPDELAGYRQIIERKGGTEGHIDYPDYKGTNVPQANLGGFNYKDGEITDKYDFNTNRGGPYEKYLAARLLESVINPVGMAASIGRRIVPPGAGVPVRIKLEQEVPPGLAQDAQAPDDSPRPDGQSPYPEMRGQPSQALINAMLQGQAAR
jgi:hypothetical protein